MSSMFILLALGLCVICMTMADDIDSAPPHIVFIIADDLGWGNVGFHNPINTQISTPNMDSLKENGLELQRHYVACESSPTRSSFQSGRLPVHVTGGYDSKYGALDPEHGIPSDMTTIATKLRDSVHGYGTHLIGKWDCGFASNKQLPTRKGYDTFFGYLTSSIDYFSKHMIDDKGEEVCDLKQFNDLWMDGEPMAALDNTQYSEYEFLQHFVSIVEAHSAENSDTPLFINYNSHLPHSPLELPKEYVVEHLLGVESEDDTLMCFESGDHTSIYPNVETTEQDAFNFGCRQLLQAQVNLLDEVVGLIVATLKDAGLWDNTLLVLTTDNGGSLDLDHTAGNNWPLRGGKETEFEGGIKATTIVSGGYLPEARRGHTESGLMHIADWYSTFCQMLGIDASDTSALENDLPDFDGYNMWPLISGAVTGSPRADVVISRNVLIVGEYKLNIADQVPFNILQGPIFPNASTPSMKSLEATTMDCQSGCLFNVALDPGERTNLANDELYTEHFRGMKARLIAMQSNFYKNDRHGQDSCPAGYNDKNAAAAENSDSAMCGCWMASINYDGFIGPYQDLGPDEIHWQPIGVEATVLEFHLYVEIVLVLMAVVILTTSVCFFVKFRNHLFVEPPMEGVDSVNVEDTTERTPLISSGDKRNSTITMPGRTVLTEC